MEKRVQFGGVVRIGQLADKICRSHQTRLGIRFFVVLIFGNRKSCQFNCAGNTLAIEQPMTSKSFADRNLSAGDVIRRQNCIACPSWELKTPTLLIDDHARCVIRRTCTPNESDVMAQQAEDEVHPVDGFNGSDEHSSADDFLTDLGNENRVLEIMIESVTGTYALNQKPSAGVEKRRTLTFPITEVVTVGVGQSPAECLCRQGSNVQHDLTDASDL